MERIRSPALIRCRVQARLAVVLPSNLRCEAKRVTIVDEKSTKTSLIALIRSWNHSLTSACLSSLTWTAHKWQTIWNGHNASLMKGSQRSSTTPISESTVLSVSRKVNLLARKISLYKPQRQELWGKVLRRVTLWQPTWAPSEPCRSATSLTLRCKNPWRSIWQSWRPSWMNIWPSECWNRLRQLPSW